MLRVGSKFDTFDELSQRLEEFQKVERVQLWVRDSRTVIAAAKRARRKSLNPALKYAELTYSCVFGGRRPSDQTKVHNQTSAGGCPFKVRLSTSGDGQALVVKEICNTHNHEPGKKLHDEPRRLYKKNVNSRTSHDTENTTTSNNTNYTVSATTTTTVTNNALRKPIKLIVNKNRINNGCTPFANLQQLQQQHISTHHLPKPLKLQLHTTLDHQHCYIKKEEPEQQLQQQHISTHHLPKPLKLQLQTTLDHQHCYIKKEEPEQLMDVDIGYTPEHIDTPEHLLNVDMQLPFSYGTPNSSNTPPSTSSSNSPSSSTGNTPNISPNTSPPNSLSSGTEDVTTYYLPPSPISPNTLSNSSIPELEEEERLEPIYDLQEALEDGLASLPSFDLDEFPNLNIVTDNGYTVCPRRAPHNMHNYNAQQLPVLRTLPTHVSSLRVGYTNSNGNNCNNFSTVYKPSKSILTSNGNFVLSTDCGSMKTIKNSYGHVTHVPSVQYNVLSSKLVAGSNPKNGRFTIGSIQQINSVVSTNTTNTTPTMTNKGASTLINGGLPLIGGTHTIVGANNNNNCSNNNSVASCPITGLTTSSGGGIIRNYRAKISKKPYGGVASVLKVVRSDVPRPPVDTADKLLTDGGVGGAAAAAAATAATAAAAAAAAAGGGICGGGGGGGLVNKIQLVEVSKINNTTLRHGSLSKLVTGDLDAMDNTFNNRSEMDKVISGGLNENVKIKTELPDLFENSLPCSGLLEQESNSMCGKNSIGVSDGVIGGSICDDTTLENDLEMDGDLNDLFVMDGLNVFDGHIPIPPETLFNVADMDNYDVYMF